MRGNFSDPDTRQRINNLQAIWTGLRGMETANLVVLA
jgi:hypothetical protein